MRGTQFTGNSDLSDEISICPKGKGVSSVDGIALRDFAISWLIGERIAYLEQEEEDPSEEIALLQSLGEEEAVEYFVTLGTSRPS
jgi:hypothetical protein